MMSGGPTGRVALGWPAGFATTTLVVLELMRHAWMPYAQPGPFLCLEIDRSTGKGLDSFCSFYLFAVRDGVSRGAWPRAGEARLC